MRVLRISHSSVVDAWRGRERALINRGVDVALVTARRFPEAGRVVGLTPRPGERVIGVRTFGSHPALFLYDPRPVWQALGERWDLIDIHEEPFALATAEILFLRALRRVRTPFTVYTAQNLDKRYPAPFRWFERWALRSASGVSTCSADAAAIAVAKGFAGSPHVIPLGIDPAEFSQKPVEGGVSSPAGNEGGPITVGLLGRLVPEKGALVLLDAVARDARLRATIVGSGPLAPELRRRATALGIADRVEIHPSIRGEAVAEFFRSIDVLAVPSLPTPRWTEQFGRVAVESMASGVPVVTSDAGALPEVVGEAGLVVAHGDSAALARALADAGGARREELSAAGAARVEKYTWDAVADDYLALYRSALREISPADRPVEIIVVAFGAPALLRVALEPVVGLPVTVVDNSSLPEIAALCAELGVRYVDAEENRGFASGVNIGLAHLSRPAADVLLLNPDARIEPEQIDALVRRLRQEPRLASVAPAQLDGAGHRSRVEWPFPTPLNAWLEALGLARLQRGPRFVIGSVLLLRSEALAHVGGFDEDFFLYAEETDWAYRASRLGWRHAEVLDATATHVGGGTSMDDRIRVLRFHAAQERFYRKHHGAIGWQIARSGLWAGAAVRSIVLRGHRGRAARERAALLRHGPMRAAARAGLAL